MIDPDCARCRGGGCEWCGNTGRSQTAVRHEQIGEYSYSVNEHGCQIEHSLWRPSRLDDGRCCGRKPHEYKTKQGLGSIEDRHFFCLKCDREYAPTGEQRPNWGVSTQATPKDRAPAESMTRAGVDALHVCGHYRQAMCAALRREAVSYDIRFLVD